MAIDSEPALAYAHGRDGEVGRIVELAGASVVSQSKLVAIDGAPGMGKSTMVKRAITALDAAPAIYVNCRADDAEHPGTVARRALASAGVRTNETDAGALASAMRGLLADRPDRLVVVVEDSEWIDAVSGEALLAAIESVQSPRLIVIVTSGFAASTFFARVRALASGSSRGAHLVLTPLLPEDIAQVISAALGVDVGASLARRIHDATGGSPTHVAAVARWLAEARSGRRSVEAALDALRESTNPDVLAFASDVTDALASARPGTRAALELIAAAADGLPASLVERYLEQIGADPLAEAELLATGFVARDRLQRFTALHRPLAAAVAAAAPRSRRIEQHRFLAEHTSAPESLSHRLAVRTLTGETEPDEALGAGLESAGYAALGARDFDRAFELLEQASAVATSPAPLLAAARAAVYSGRPGLAARLQAWLPRIPDPASRLAITALIAVDDNDLDAAQAALDEALRAPNRDPGLTLLLGHACSNLLRNVAATAQFGRGAEAMKTLIAELGALVDALRPHADERTAPLLAEAASLSSVLRMWRLFGFGEWREMPHIVEDMLALADELERIPGTQGAVYGIRRTAGAKQRQNGEPVAARDTLTHVMAGSSSPFADAHAYVQLAYLYFDAALWDEADESSRAALASTLYGPEDAGAMFAYAAAALTAGARGKSQLAARYLRRITDAGAPVGRNPVVDAAAALSRGWLHVLAGDANAAADALLTLDENSVGWWLVGIAPAALLARCLISVGRIDEVPHVHGRVGDPEIYSAPEPRAALDAYVRGLLAQGRDPHAAAEHFTRALDIFNAQPPLRPSLAGSPGGGFRLYRSLVALDYGTLVAAHSAALADHLGAARAEVAQVHRVFARCGAAVFAKHAATTIAALAEAPAASVARTRAPAKIEGLTRREQQIAELIADGLSNREIGAELYLSVRTVEFHVRNILGKLSLDSRVALRRLIRAGS